MLEKLKKTNRKTVIALSAFAVVLILASVLAFAVFFQQKEKGGSPPRLSVDQITDTLVSELQFKDVVKLQPEQVSKYYTLPTDSVEACSIYISKASDKSFELSCFQITDQERRKELHTVISTHVKEKSDSFQELSPTEYNKIQNYIILEKKNLILFAISDDNKAVEKIFNRLTS